jgi:hypothetical protein
VPTGDVETTPDPVSVTITSGIGAAVNFGLFQTGSISGAVFDDVNSDGTQETNELGLSGRTVFIDAAHNGVLTAGDPEATTNPPAIMPSPTSDRAPTWCVKCLSPMRAARQPTR